MKLKCFFCKRVRKRRSLRVLSGPDGKDILVCAHHTKIISQLKKLGGAMKEK